MANPFFESMKGRSQQPSIMQQFDAFRKNFQGDPKEKVQELLNSGQMSQEQFNMLSQMAQKFIK
jgi:hypothetical protein